MKNIFIPFIILFAACTQGGNKAETSSEGVPNTRTNKSLNISVFLDLSDRISPDVNGNASMEFYQRDLGYLESIVNAFEQHTLATPIRLMDERIQLFVDPLPMNQQVNGIIQDLKFGFTKENASKENIEQVRLRYQELASKLYALTIEDNRYVGSDIWGFFKNKVNDYCISQKHRNILIILTDGYIYHQDNVLKEDNRTSYLTSPLIRQLGLNSSHWAEVLKTKNCGFLVSDSTLSNLEVLVLGVNSSKSNPYEYDVIHQYWYNWLSELGIQKYEIKPTDLPVNLNSVIQKFILKP